MPAITSGKVLVTGANGYIAIWVVQALLNQGFSVRGTVRSESKAGHLREVFKSFGDKLEIVVVQDITKDGAFDEAVKGVDAIEHTASPFHLHAVEPDELIIPAVQGTTSVLKSALKHGSSVRRVVVLSSCAAVLNPSTEPRVFNETNWNEGSLQEVSEKGKDASPLAKYRTSKTLAEKAAWEFYEKNKSAVEWNLVVLNPPFVFGPILHAVDVPENLNSSMNDWYTTIIQGKMDKESLAKLGSSWVDVRDLAEAHVLAITKPEAAGQRLIISAGPYKWQDWVSAARRISKYIPQGNDSYNPAEAVHMIAYETTKADSVLGVKYRGIDQSTADILVDLKAKVFSHLNPSSNTLRDKYFEAVKSPKPSFELRTGLCLKIPGHPIYDKILSHLSPVSLVRLEKASCLTRFAAKDFASRAYNINRLLSRFFTDPIAFRSLQARTAALISGSFALQFFDRTFYPESDLDLYVFPDNSPLLIGQWLQAEGYEFLPNSRQDTDFATATTQCYSMGSHVHPDEFQGPLDRTHATLYMMRGVEEVFTFVRPTTDSKNPDIPAKVQIVVTKTTPLECILGFHSTCVMNLITYNTAFSLYPYETFERREAMAIAADEHQADALRKYARRGWRIIANETSLIQMSLSAHAPRTALFADHFAFDTTRWLDDSISWVIPLDTTGVTLPPPLSPSSAPLSWDPVAQNSWTFRRSGNEYIMRFRYIRTTIMKYRYTVADDKYIKMLIPFFRGQGKLEHKKEPSSGTTSEDYNTWWDSVLPVFRAKYMQDVKEGRMSE
ncbi:NADPH-dependent methylglyoxal reductase GRE2 [Grifola frondosa]|uniref:NADPH-dependent methylglyoxal reductase GRE2 n=1 Tax=Grifola frondosa TaxID=5627 RepID=A0A1C7MMZ3_GRIFR|nr:NADPH-dependent methylglyoxal reductase GRE2 [Grifola frondosa]